MSAADTAAAGAWAPRRRVSTRFLRSELKLIVRRRRNLAGFAALAAMPIVLTVVIAATRPAPGSGPPLFADMVGNGLIAALAGLAVEMPLFLPAAVSVIAGDSVAGEANTGTLRYLLAVPAGRVRLLAVKFTAVALTTAGLVALVAVAGGVTGVALFGTGDLVTLSGTTIPFGEALGRVLLAAAYLAVCLVALAAVGVFASTLTEQPIGVAIAMLMFVIAGHILGALTQLDWLHPYLITDYWTAWDGLLRDPAAYGSMGTGLISAGVHTVLALSAAWARLTTKDVTG